MEGQLALAAELLAGADDAGAEQSLPEAVDGDARGQRVLGAHQPLRQGQAVARGVLGQRREHGGRPRGDFLAQVLPIAAELDPRDTAFLGVELLEDRDGDRFQGRQFAVRGGEAAAFRRRRRGHLAHVVLRQHLLLGRTARARGFGHRRQDGRRQLDDGRHTGVASVAQAELAERVARVLALLLQRDAQLRARRQGDRGRSEQGQHMRTIGRARDGPAGILLGVIGAQHGSRRETVLFMIGECDREMHRHRPREGESLLSGRRGRGPALPDFAPLGIEQHHAEAFQALAGVAIGAVPHHHALHGLRALQIELPPGIAAPVRGVRHAALRVLAVGAAIDRARGRRIGVGAALAGAAAPGQVVGAAEHLHLGELQQLVRPGQLDADVARLRGRLIGRRHDLGLHAGEHKVAKPGLRCGGDAQGGELGTGERGDDRVGFAGLRRGRDHPAVLGRARALLRLQRHLFGPRVGRFPGQRTRHAGLPCGLTGQPGGLRLAKAPLKGVDLLLQALALRLQLRRVERVQGGFVLLVGIGGLVEEGVELEVLLERDGVVLVGVALRAGHRRAHPDRKGGVDAVDHGGVAELLVAGTALVLGHGVAMEGGGDELRVRGLGQQVAGQLLDGELVERLIAVERLDHPVAVGPDLPSRVARIAGAVGVARQVEPEPRPVLAERRPREVVVDHGLDRRGRGRAGRSQTLQFLERRRQAGQVEGEPPEQGTRIGGCVGRQAFTAQALVEEGVHRMAARRHLGADHLLVAPVPAPLGALADPLPEQGHLGRRNGLVLLGRRHDLIRILRDDALDERAALRIAGHHGGHAVAGHLRLGFVVEAQAALALLVIGSVAKKAVLREDRPDLAGKIHGGRPVEGGQRQQQSAKGAAHRRSQRANPRHLQSGADFPKAGRRLTSRAASPKPCAPSSTARPAAAPRGRRTGRRRRQLRLRRTG